MLIVYDSRTGHVNRFAEQLAPLCSDRPALRIRDGLRVDEPFVLLTYTTGFGQAPETVYTFLQHNHIWLRGVAASGNRNWGDAFARSADAVSDRYRVPVLGKFELSGTGDDLRGIAAQIKSIQEQGGARIASY